MSSKDNNIEVVVRAIDEFSKAMGDFKSYLKGISDQSASTEKSVNSLGDRMMGLGNIMKGAMLQLGADVFELLKNGLESVISLIPQAYEQGYQWVAMVQQMQVETGLSATDVSKLAAEMRTMGIDTGDSSIILARFGKNLVDSESKFRDLGIATRDQNGNLLDAMTVIDNTRRRVAELGPSFMSAAAAQDLFGRSGYKMLEFLSLSDDQMNQLAESAAKMGLVLSQDTIDAAHRFGIEMNNLNNTITGIQTSIFAGLEPSLEHFIDSFANFIQANLNNIVGFVVGVANFIMGVIGGIFGIDFSAQTLAGAVTSGESAPTGAQPTPAPKAAGKTGGRGGVDPETQLRQARIKEIDAEIAALQALDTAQQATQQQASLQQAIADAQSQLTDLQSSVLNTYGLSDAERIKAEQKRAADTVTASKKVADTQKTYADYGVQEARKAQIDQLNVLKAGLQAQNTAQTGSAAIATAAYLTQGTAAKTLGQTILDGMTVATSGVDDFKTQAQIGLAAGLGFSDWIKKTLTPALQAVWKTGEDLLKFLQGVLGWINDVMGWVGSLDGVKLFLDNFQRGLDALGPVLGGVAGAIGTLVQALKTLWTWITDTVGGHTGVDPKNIVDQFGGGTYGPGTKHYGSGGYVDRPTLAWIGEGRESEHVIPSSMLQEALNFTAANGGGRGGGGSVIMIDKRVLGQVIDEAMGSKMPAGMARLNR